MVIEVVDRVSEWGGEGVRWGERAQVSNSNISNGLN